jgi:hypothetical protein
VTRAERELVRMRWGSDSLVEDTECLWEQLPLNPDDLSSGLWYEVWQVDGGKVHVMAQLLE